MLCDGIGVPHISNHSPSFSPNHIKPTPRQHNSYGPEQPPTALPTVSNALADIAAVFDFMAERHGVRQEDCVLYGQSVGSGPTVREGAGARREGPALARPLLFSRLSNISPRSHPNLPILRIMPTIITHHHHHHHHPTIPQQCWLAVQKPNVAGVVLHSPLLSGARVLRPDLRFFPARLDVFPNHVLAPKIKAPLLVHHGTADEVVDVSAGRRLAALAPNAVAPLIAEVRRGALCG